MKRNGFVFCIVLFFVASCVSTNNIYEPLQNKIKSGSKLNDGVKIITSLKKDSDAISDPKFYYLSAQLYKKIYDAENEKLYLHSKYDTVTFYSSILEIYKYINLCDSKETDLCNKNKEEKYHYRSNNYDLLKSLYPNLRYGGLFFYNKKDYKNALKYFSLYLNCANWDILKKDSLLEKNESVPEISYLNVYCYNFCNLPDSVITYSKYSLLEDEHRCAVLNMLVSSYGEIKDSVNYERTLLEGVEEFPSFSYFYTHLIDYYNQIGKESESIVLVDRLLEKDSTNYLLMYSKSVILMRQKKYFESAQVAQTLIEKDTTCVDAYFNVGACFNNLAVDLLKSINYKADNYKQTKELIILYFKKSLPFMEKYRALAPDKKDKWGPILYRVYLNLNMGKEFDEMDKLLNEY